MSLKFIHVVACIRDYSFLLSGGIQLYKYIMICFFLSPIDPHGDSQFGAIKKLAAISILMYIFVWVFVLTYLGRYLEVE